MIRGIDVSSHQHPNGAHIDWPAVAADDVHFVIIKATEGVGYLNPYFGGDWLAAKANGLVRGAYHYALPSATSATDEADYFVDNVGHLLEPGDLVALDFEDPKASGNLADWALAWLVAVEHQIGFAPLFYSYPNYLDTRHLHDERLAPFGLWYASYRADMPAAPAPWPFIAIWQYTSQAPVAGLLGDIDANLFNGDDLDQLRLYGKPGAVVPPPPFNVGPGVRSAMDRAHDEPVGDEVYITPDLSFTPGKSGHYWYSKVGDSVGRVQKG